MLGDKVGRAVLPTSHHPAGLEKAPDPDGIP